MPLLRGLQAVAVLGGAMLILHWLARRFTADLPPVEPPAKRFWGEGRGTRLRFRVGRKKGALQAAANASHSERPLARPVIADDRLQISPNRTAARCRLDGTETDGGCSGQACLLGACFCSGGSVGEWCERRPAERVTCAAEERQAYGVLASGLKRHTAHDACAFYSSPYGTLAVDARRWEAAQEWEAALWAASAAGVTTDRNEHHKRHFDNYAEVPRQLGHVVEVGCGPFTQLQTILPSRPRPSSITLLDPLLETYARRVRGCPYSRGKLLGTQVALVTTPLEELELPQKADVLVMISVLQSVRDVPRAMQAAYRALRPGGVLVFSERAFDERWEAYTRSGRTEAAAFWDVGHPCAVKLVVLEHFMAAFREMYHKRHMHPTAHGPPDEQIYFVGRKPRNKQFKQAAGPAQVVQ